jgi:glycosyltransferase involved in cell wall biosynthesis
MASGVPLLTSDLPPHRELLGDAGVDALVQDFSVETWVERATQLIEAQDRLSQLGEVLLNRAGSVWSTRNLQAQWTTFLNAVARV